MKSHWTKGKPRRESPERQDGICRHCACQPLISHTLMISFALLCAVRYCRGSTDCTLDLRIYVYQNEANQSSCVRQECQEDEDSCKGTFHRKRKVKAQEIRADHFPHRQKKTSFFSSFFGLSGETPNSEASKVTRVTWTLTDWQPSQSRRLCTGKIERI